MSILSSEILGHLIELHDVAFESTVDFISLIILTLLLEYCDHFSLKRFT